MQLIAFVAVMLAITVLIHWYLWKRLVRDTTRPGPARRAGTIVGIALTVLVPATLVGSRTLPPTVARWLAWPGYIWVALFFYLLVVLLVLEIPRAVLARAARNGRTPSTTTAGTGGPSSTTTAGLGGPSSTATGGTGGTSSATMTHEPVVSRRLVLARSVAAVAGVAAVGTVGYGMTSALGPPRVTALSVPIRRLPGALDGLRIAVVSDIHLGPLRGRGHTERIVRMINEQGVDLVAIVGDLVDGTVDELGDAAAPLRDLVSTHGSFFVTGNHEYYSGVAPWLRELDRLGVRPLLNERTQIQVGDGVLDLAGVNDVNAEESGEQGPDFERALGGRDTGRPVVLLAHQPVQVEQAARHGVDLQLSGHTHGGQMFPFHGLVRLEQPALSGLHRFDDTQLFVTRGAGFWGPPVRVGAPPEFAVVRLTPSA